jgi:hypothetical protein
MLVKYEQLLRLNNFLFYYYLGLCSSFLKTRPEAICILIFHWFFHCASFFYEVYPSIIYSVNVFTLPSNSFISRDTNKKFVHWPIKLLSEKNTYIKYEIWIKNQLKFIIKLKKEIIYLLIFKNTTREKYSKKGN